MRQVDIAAVVRLARAAADELVFRAEDPGPEEDLFCGQMALTIVSSAPHLGLAWSLTTLKLDPDPG